jgi:photosystem II stability/assembly factor-like uncharacterized protein
MNSGKSFIHFFILITILFIFFSYSKLQSQNFWERTSGPGTVTVYDFLFKENSVYIGTYHGGMFKSTNGGDTWQQIENEFTEKSVYTLELLSNGNILAGTGSGIHLSSDNGESWFHSSLDDNLITTFDIDAVGTIYAGSLYSSTVFRSIDNGLNWAAINFTENGGGVGDIEVKNVNTILIASGWIYKSSDYGETWDTVFTGAIDIIDLALNSLGEFYAISLTGAFYTSADDGAIWTQISNLPVSYGRKIFVTPDGNIFAGGSGIYRSSDGGISWDTVLIPALTGHIRDISSNGDELYAGAYFMGAYKSIDQGSHWVSSNKGLNNSSVSFLLNDFTGRIISTGNLSGMAFTSDNGFNWSLLSPIGQLNSFSASPNGSLFASQSGGYSGVILRSTDNGYNWGLIFMGSYDTTVTQVNVNIDATVYAIINGKLYKSTNNGDDWEIKQIVSENEQVNIIYFNSTGIIFVRTTNGHFRSSDNGETWEQLNSIPEGLNIFGITQADEIYATASDSGYYRSTNLGDSWKFLSKGTGRTINAFASNSIGYLFISIFSLGVFRSTDNGIIWQEVDSGLDSSNVNALIVTNDDYLLAGTSWKGVYRSVSITTSIENYFTKIPAAYKLEQNYPNPFNPTTHIRYSINKRQFVSLKVYDVLGKEVITLVKEEKEPGIYEVEFSTFSEVNNFSSGIYFYQLETDSFTETKKMILLR